MRSPRLPLIFLAPWALVALAALSACGKKIGDSCSLPSDCSSDGDRICDLTPPDGYCTIAGCDFATCPEEAVCVRFYPGDSANITCESQADCAFDEICTVGKHCAQRTSELRFCMLTCGGNDDCRDGYECRDRAVMVLHGGEPVPDPTRPDAVSDFQPFCAQRQSCSGDPGCSVGDRCDDDTSTCVARNEPCTSQADCDPNSLIEVCNTTLNMCVRPCDFNIDCEADERCNQTNNLCEAR